MFVGKVIGTVWSTVKWPEVQGLKLLVVRPYHLADLANLGDLNDLADLGEPTSPHNSPPGSAPARNLPTRTDTAAADSAPRPSGGPDCEAVVCVDLLDAGVGDDVVVAFGHAARVAAQMETKSYAQSFDRSFDRSFGQNAPEPRGSATNADPKQNASSAVSAIVPIDAAVVAIVDSIEVTRPRS